MEFVICWTKFHKENSSGWRDELVSSPPVWIEQATQQMMITDVQY